MNMFYRDITSQGLREIQHGKTGLCTYRGVSCVGKDVHKIRYQQFTHGNFNIHILPSSVETLMIMNCEQEYTLDTRSLPRKLKILSLSSNAIYGTIDLTALPEKIEKINLWQNSISGPICLHRLPETLQQLYLHQNAINQEVVFYDNLPEGIIINLLGNRASNHTNNSIKEVRALNPENAVKDKGVLAGINRRKVH